MGTLRDVTPDLFRLSQADNEDVITQYSYLEAARYLPEFSWMKDLLPSHLTERFDAAMKKKSDVFILPLLFKDEKKEIDCIDILDATLDWIYNWYKETYPGKLNLYNKMRLFPFTNLMVSVIIDITCKDCILCVAVKHQSFLHSYIMASM